MSPALSERGGRHGAHRHLQRLSELRSLRQMVRCLRNLRPGALRLPAAERASIYLWLPAPRRNLRLAMKSQREKGFDV